MVAFVAIEVGGVLAFSSGDTKKLAEEIKEFGPTHIPTVPRLLEKIHTRVVSQAAAAGGAKAEIFARALKTGDKLALSKVREPLGPGNPVLITGAAPIGTDVIEFFYACGVPVLEGYGMTETCAAATLNIVSEVKVGSVGRPLPGTEVSIGD